MWVSFFSHDFDEAKRGSGCIFYFLTFCSFHYIRLCQLLIILYLIRYAETTLSLRLHEVCCPLGRVSVHII